MLTSLQQIYVKHSALGANRNSSQLQAPPRANFKLFHLYFNPFLVRNIIFSAIF